MKTENKHKYYNDGDEINFEKLNNFRKFNSNLKNNIQSNNHNIKYANSDKNYFNNILKINENLASLKKLDIKDSINYYNSSDFQKFDNLDNFPKYEDNLKKKESKNISSGSTYTSNDFSEFNKIVQFKNNEEKIINDKIKKVKIIDYKKLKDNEKKLKNKVGIEKIKVIYFD